MSFAMYYLTTRGLQLSHIPDNNSPEMRVVHYLARQHKASGDAIYQNTGADIGILAKLARKGVISKE